MKATLINLTPHDIKLYLPGDAINQVCFQVSEYTARCEEVISSCTQLETDPCGDAGFYVEAPLVTRSLSTTAGLPGPRDGTMYIVALPVQQANPDRQDLVTPYPLVRDERGYIIGCSGFARLG